MHESDPSFFDRSLAKDAPTVVLSVIFLQDFSRGEGEESEREREREREVRLSFSPHPTTKMNVGQREERRNRNSKCAQKD